MILRNDVHKSTCLVVIHESTDTGLNYQRLSLTECCIILSKYRGAVSCQTTKNRAVRTSTFQFSCPDSHRNDPLPHVIGYCYFIVSRDVRFREVVAGVGVARA